MRPAVLLLALILVSAAQAETISGRVVAIQDGDTLTILDASNVQHHIRVNGIDAEEALETVQPAVQAKSFHVTVDVAPDLPAIDADPDRLRQAFWNVLSNAVKFTPAGGTITVSATCRGDAIRIEVADAGCGVPADFLPYIFDRFRQADSSDTRRYQGLGLGLAIVRHLVEAHGGTIAAASGGSDRGARITIELTVSAAGASRSADAH